MNEDFIAQYLDYIGESEAPTFYHRWCCLSMIGAYLGRQYSFILGHFELYTNLYCMLLGSPGARKSTAIKIAKKIIQQSGYNKLSADRSTKEKFLLDLSGEDTKSVDDILDQNLWGAENDSSVSEMYIACDEFNNFIGNGNIEFVSLLGELWDYTGPPYENRIKNGKSVCIPNPTISILGGNTPTGFSTAFPPTILGQGFFSRLLLIHGEPTGKKITFPELPSAESTASVITALQTIKTTVIGVASAETTAKKLLDKIYKTWKGIDDVRFDHYSNRRFSHLLKLCLITSAARYSSTISERDVIYANTILTHTERLMPKAMGEFGKAKNSDVSHKVMQLLDTTDTPLGMKDLWEHLHSDMDKMKDLGDILGNLVAANKIMGVAGGFLPKKKVIEETSNDVVDYGMLTDEEKGMTT